MMFLYELFEIKLLPFVLEGSVIFRQAWVFFPWCYASIRKSIFIEIIYFALMFGKFFQQTKSAIILRYRNFFLLWLDQQSPRNVGRTFFREI